VWPTLSIPRLAMVIRVTEVLDCLTDGACVVSHSCFSDSLSDPDCPRCPDSSSEHLGLIDSSDSESDILLTINLNMKMMT